MDLLLKGLVDIPVDDPGVAAGVHLSFELVVLVNEPVETVSQLLHLAHEFLVPFLEGGEVLVVGRLVDLGGLYAFALGVASDDVPEFLEFGLSG